MQPMTKFISIKLQKALFILLMFDFLTVGAFAFLAPVYALFVSSRIQGGNAVVVGVALAVYFVVKSVLQLPIARFIDKNNGEVDDVLAMIIGTIIAGLAMFLYVFASEIWHVYALQFLYGLGDALAVPPFYAIFTRHIDKGAEGFEWALRSSFSFGGGSALGGVIGGILAVQFGFEIVFIVIAILSLFSAGILFFLRDYILLHVPKDVFRPPLDLKKL